MGSLVLTLVAATGLAAEPAPRACVTKIRVGGPVDVAPAERANFDAFDHSLWDALLRKFVDCQGLVCYQAWKCDPSAMALLDAYLRSLGTAKTNDPSASAAGELAFFINAYNALVVYGILLEYPTASIQEHNRRSASYRIFDDLEIWIDGEYLSLNHIEHDILRNLHEPRVHFAIVCAAKGCPRLRNEAYTPSRAEEQLADNTIDFFRSRERFRICRLTHRVHLSPILMWFREDFGRCDWEILQSILPYVPCRERAWLMSHPCARISYLGYNWALNDRCPTARVRLGSVPYVLYAEVEPHVRPLLKLRRPMTLVQRLPLPGFGGRDASTEEPEMSRDGAEGADAPASDPVSTPVSEPSPPRAIEPREEPETPSPPKSLDPSLDASDAPEGLPPTPEPPRAIQPREVPTSAARAVMPRWHVERRARSPVPTITRRPLVSEPR